ncbi:MAG TPA: TetR/AcrR family transcriptional regulator [Solirubrobacterales bacterium]|nr:TetR/AcrR family transcriptional regulator [Solirubrobacterales bacterium]
METLTPEARPPTRERVLAAALRLFAERGYQGTTVGEVEAAAGLAPRSGALYRHFPSKRALIEAAIADRVEAVDALERRFDLLPLDDLRSELRLIARLTLDELDRERDLVRLVMKEGDRFPELAEAFHEGIVSRGHRIGVEWLRSRAPELGLDLPDPEATAHVFADALVGYALQRHLFGDREGMIDRERIVDAFVDLAAALLAGGEGGG